MATGKTIASVDVGAVIGAMKIPVGGSGNTAITPKMLLDFFNQQSSIYITSNPSINRANGMAQDLRLTGESKLTFTQGDAQSVFLRVTGEFGLDIGDFHNVNNFYHNPNKSSLIAIINWNNGVQYLFGINYDGAHVEPIPPEITCEGATKSITITFDAYVEQTEVPIWHIEVYNGTNDQLISSCTNNDVAYGASTIAAALQANRLYNEIDFTNEGDEVTKLTYTFDEELKLKIIAKGWTEDEMYGIEITSIDNSNPTAFFVKNEVFDYDLRVCLAAQSSNPITCEGAIKTFKWVPAVRTGTTPAVDITVLVDGAPMIDPPSWLQIEVLPEAYPDTPPDGFSVGGIGVYQWTNNDTVEHRFEVISNNPTDVVVLGYANPTVIELDTTHTHFGVCLSTSGGGGIPLGCEGATNVLNFERLHGPEFELGWVDELGNRIPYTTGTIDDIRIWLDQHAAVQMTLENDGFGRFTYFGSTYQRFYILMIDGSGEMSVPTGNPAYMGIIVSPNGDQTYNGYQWCMGHNIFEWRTSARVIGYYPVGQITFDIEVDGQVYSGLVYEESGDRLAGTWDNVPLTVGISPDNTAIYIKSIGSLPMHSVTISSPNYEFRANEPEDTFPDESTVVVEGTGLGNVLKTSLLEYVGDEITGDTIFLNAAWVTGVSSFILGTAEYLQWTNDGAYHQGYSVGRTVPHVSVEAAVDFFQNEPRGAFGGQTLAQITGLEFSVDSGSGNLRVYNLNPHQVTVLIHRNGGDFNGCLNSESDSLDSIRYREGSKMVLRLAGAT